MRTAYLLRPLALAVALPFAALASGCDTIGSTDTFGNVVDVVSFNLHTADMEVSGDGYTATFASDNVRDGTAQNLIEEILDDPDVTTDGVVLLYAEDDLIIGPTASGDVTRWAALPYTEGFESTTIPAVDVTLTYAYSFDAGDPDTNDDGNLYFDVSASSAIDFAAFLAQRLEGATTFRLKLVAIPGALFTQSGLRAGDLQNYETVRRAFHIAAE